MTQFKCEGRSSFVFGTWWTVVMGECHNEGCSNVFVVSSVGFIFGALPLVCHTTSGDYSELAVRNTLSRLWDCRREEAGDVKLGG